MHIITQKKIWQAQRKYLGCESALDTWYRSIHRGRFENFAALKAYFKSVDKVGNLYIFNIGGNKLRLIAGIHFNRQKLYIQEILSHKEYSFQTWKLRSH